MSSLPVPRMAGPELQRVRHVSQQQRVLAQAQRQEQEKVQGEVPVRIRLRVQVRVQVYGWVYGRVRVRVQGQLWLQGKGLAGRLRLDGQKQTAELVVSNSMSVDELAERCSCGCGCSCIPGSGRVDRNPGQAVRNQLEHSLQNCQQSYRNHCQGLRNLYDHRILLERNGQVARSFLPAGQAEGRNSE